MIILYNIFIRLYSLVAYLMSLFNDKAKKWVQGRNNVMEILENVFYENPSKYIWIHCASLGEFEQARPIIEKLKTDYNLNYKILLTFFSPSGYEIQKDYKYADLVFYLPVDTHRNAKRFVEIVKPSIAIFVKYEFWFHYFKVLKESNINLILVSGIFRENQPFFKWYGKLHRQMLDCVSHFFLQNEQSKNLLLSIKAFNNISVIGDTRFDRVLQIFTERKIIIEIEKFIGESKTIVAGSTWTEDDEELDHYANSNNHIKFIIAPHEVNKDRLDECLKLYKNAVLFSDIANATNKTNVVIIDNIGMLSSLYAYATICYVGGGFGADGVHNVLEPAVYGKPVVFGEEYDKFIEAAELIQCNGAVSVKNALELEKTFNELLSNKKMYDSYCDASKFYVIDKAGATDKIVGYLSKNLLLTMS